MQETDTPGPFTGYKLFRKFGPYIKLTISLPNKKSGLSNVNIQRKSTNSHSDELDITITDIHVIYNVNFINTEENFIKNILENTS